MSLSEMVAPHVARRLEELALELDGAAAIARALLPAARDGTAAGLGVVLDESAGLLARVGRAAFHVHHVAVLAEEACGADALAMLPEAPAEPGDEERARALEDALCSTPGWSDASLPADLDPLVVRVRSALEWLAVRSFGVRDHLNTLATLQHTRAMVRLIESVIAPAAEHDTSRRYQALQSALELTRTRLGLRRSREEGSS